MKRSLALLLVLAAVGAAVAQDLPTQAAATDAANVPAAAPEPKKPGVTRLGLVLAKAELGAAPAAPEALRTVLTEYLSGPQIEVVPIAAMVPMQVDAEANLKGCDYVFYVSLSQKQQTRRTGWLRSARALTQMVPVISMAGRAAALVSQAAAMTAITAADQLSSGVTAKSEITFEYQLLAPATTSSIVAGNEKVTAQADRQDVITPLVERAATAVANALLKR